MPGRGGWHLARIHGIEVPARREDVGPTARGCAVGTGRHEAAVEGCEQAGRLGVGARVQRRADGLGYFVHHGGARTPLGRQAPAAGNQAGREALQALHRVAGAAPGHTVGERLRPRAPPGLAERGRERVDAEGEVVRQRTQDGGLSGAGSAHAPRDGAQKLVAALGLRRFAEDVETVANLHLLDFAEITIELAERVAAAVCGVYAAILVEPDGGGKLQDARAQGRATTRVDRGRVEELVHQPLQFLQRAVAAGAGERRRQVIDDHCSPAPLGLAALAGGRSR